MLHIKELSWLHIKHPSDVVKVGDSIEVFVKSIDREKKKISLGHKTEETNPWKIFTDTYSEGDVAEVTIVSVLTFGAFAQIIPGVDGLIHISQIADKKIADTASEVKVGEKVQAKIVAIDAENKKVSLSIRALIEKEEAPAEEAAEVATEETAE
jgi:4-hydroxy-3-methylbut-2-enyl diphosphate reductase